MAQCSGGTRSAVVSWVCVGVGVGEGAGSERTVGCLCAGGGARLLLELVGEGHVVDEGPGVVELVVPDALEVGHALEHSVELVVTDEG
jgi:hypothetical protein